MQSENALSTSTWLQPSCGVTTTTTLALQVGKLQIKVHRFLSLLQKFHFIIENSIR